MAILVSKYTPKQKASRQKASLGWRARNPEKVREAAQRPHKKAYAAKWRRNNAEKCAAYTRKWQLANPEKHIQGVLAWQAANPEKVRVIDSRKTAKRRALKQNRLHIGHDTKLETQMIVAAKTLTAKTGIRHDVDHVIPLARGGWHHHDNLQVLDANTNSRKHANPFWRKDYCKTWAEVNPSLWPEQLRGRYNKILTEESNCLS
jgi:hypothetical protein